MALGFFGSYEHSLDAKGRVILPARFRAEFATHAYLSRHLEGCLALWTPEEFEKQYAEMIARQNHSPGDRNYARMWAGTSSAVEIDRQGRVAVPKNLQTFAGLEGTVLVMGALDRIELWSPAAWQLEVGPAEAIFRGTTASPPTAEPAG